jgi:ATP-dependent Lhr-like helicase
MQGSKALDTVVSQLEGFEAAAGAWESEILPARLADYRPTWLDDRCLAGQVAWIRLRPRGEHANGETRAAPVRTTPITLLERRHVPLWTSLSPHEETVHASGRSQAVLDCIREQGASFLDELVEGTGLLRMQVEEALAELVALGLVTSDSFGGLRALLVPASDRRAGGRRRRRSAAFDIEDAGRWALVRRSRPPTAKASGEATAVEHVARALLRRYGVVFWRLLEREAAWLPPWRELLRVYRRLESRGDVRGGRFVAGFTGEQFALPDAVGILRETRRRPVADEWVAVSGADPLNLVGILTPGPKLAALAGNRLLFRDGVPAAVLAGGEIRLLGEFDPPTEWQARTELMRPAVRPPSLASIRAALDDEIAA